jgi:hypothetical protein
MSESWETQLRSLTIDGQILSKVPQLVGGKSAPINAVFGSVAGKRCLDAEF